MKKSILLIIFCALGAQLSYASQGQSTVMSKKPVSRPFQGGILQLQYPSNPSTDSQKKFQSPRTPRVPERYYIPYFFDGTAQYIFLKKNDDKAVASLNPLLIPLSEKEQFKEKIEDLFTVRSEQDEAIWLEKKPEGLKEMNNEYETYLVYDNRLSEEIKKQIKSFTKTASFIPLFYIIINDQLNLLNKENQEKELSFLFPTQANLYQKKSKEAIEKNINNIIKEKFKIENFKYTFSPIVITENNTQIVFMQMIDVSDVNLNDASEKNEYVRMSLEQILNSNPISSKNVIQMKEYIKKLYNKFYSKNIDQTKIDQTFDALFIEKYKQHEQEIEEKLEKKKLEIIAKQQVKKRKKEIIENQEEIKRQEREEKQRALQKEQSELFAALKNSNPQQIIETNVKPTKVIEEKKKEKKKIKQILKEKNIKQNEAQNVVQPEKELIAAINSKPQPSEIKQKPRAKSQGQLSSAKGTFTKYPQELNHINQIITFVSNLFDEYDDGKKTINENIIACSGDIKKGIGRAEEIDQVWIALPLNAIKDLTFNKAYDDLKDNGNANIYIQEKLINCMYRSEIQTHAIVFLWINEKELQDSFYTQFKDDLHKNKKLYIGLNNTVDNTLLCDNKIVVCSVDSITTWLKDNEASDQSIKKGPSKVGAIFPGLVKSKRGAKQDDDKTVLSDDHGKGNTLNVAERPIAQEGVLPENTGTVDDRSLTKQDEQILPGEKNSKDSEKFTNNEDLTRENPEKLVEKNPTNETTDINDTQSKNLTQSEKNVQSNDDKKEAKQQNLINTDTQVKSNENFTNNEDLPIQTSEGLNEPLSNEVSLFDKAFSFFSNILKTIKNFFLVTIPSFLIKG